MSIREKTLKSNFVLIVVLESKGLHWCCVSRNEKYAGLNTGKVELLSIMDYLGRVCPNRVHALFSDGGSKWTGCYKSQKLNHARSSVDKTIRDAMF